MKLCRRLVCCALMVSVLFCLAGALSEGSDVFGIDASGVTVTGAVRCGSAISSNGSFTANRAISKVVAEMVRYNDGSTAQSFSLDCANAMSVDARTVFSRLHLPNNVTNECFVISLTFYSGTQSTTYTKTVYALPPLYAQAANLNSACIFSPYGQANDFLDQRYSTIWRSTSAVNTINIICPANARYIVITWITQSPNFKLDCFDEDHATLTTYTRDESYPFYRVCYTLPEGTRSVSLWVEPYSGIAEMQVYADGDTVHQDPRPMADKVDFLVFSAHLDDELLWFGGAIPSYVARGKTVGVVYMTGLDIIRVNEALNAMWRCGVKSHPLFLNFPDQRTYSYQQAVELWGDKALRDIVVTLRRYKPEVVLTHDKNGEYGHYQHCLTSDLLVEAVKMAADESYDPVSAEQYGVWQVKKLYLHLGEENTIYMPWDDLVDESGLTSLDLAYAAYDCYPSQMDRYTMDSGVLYDYHLFSLVYSSVGEDTLKNDFFENIP